MKKSINPFLIIVSAVLLGTIALSSCTSNNWPQYRGPESNMITKSKNLPTEWGEDNNVRWTYEIGGEGWSSPIVWENKVIITSCVPVKVAPPPEPQAPPPPPAGNAGQAQQGQNPPTPPPPQEEDKSYLEAVYRWQVACVDLTTGEEVWKQVAFEGNPRTKKHAATTYAGESPVTDGERIYVYFGMTGLFCYDMEGELLWKKDLGAYETQNGWGTGTSPVIFNDVLYVQVDNEQNSFLVALEAESGEQIWKVGRDEKTNYSTPIIWKNSLRTELVLGGYKGRGYDPVTGEVLWELTMAGRYNIPSAVAVKDYLYMGNAGFRDVPSTFFAVEAGAEGDISPAEGESSNESVVWSSQEAPTGNPSPLVYDGLVYLLSSRGGDLSCLDAATGEIIYQEKVDGVGACWASPWAHEDKIYFIDEQGVTSVVKAGREFELLYQNTLDDKFWASVAVTRDAYLLKGVERVYCIGL